MNQTQFEEAVALALQRSPLEKMRLIERLASTLEQDLSTVQTDPLPSLYGLWADLDVSVSDEDIEETCRKMWED
jgi:hypothetical protein